MSFVKIFQEISGDALNASLFTPEAIVTEIFSSILREVRDEVNLPLHSLSSPLLLGVALNKHSHNRPSSEYLVRWVELLLTHLIEELEQ